jgi:hypothetical protein
MAAQHRSALPLLDASGAAARTFGARSPSGALLRLSLGRTYPPLTQLQFPRFLRPGVVGVTRFGLLQVYRAPRRSVVVPVERWPRAARHQGSSWPNYFNYWLSATYMKRRLAYPMWEYYR